MKIKNEAVLVDDVSRYTLRTSVEDEKIQVSDGIFEDAEVEGVEYAIPDAEQLAAWGWLVRNRKSGQHSVMLDESTRKDRQVYDWSDDKRDFDNVLLLFHVVDEGADRKVLLWNFKKKPEPERPETEDKSDEGD